MGCDIFASPPQVGAVVTLVLIENSQRMLAAWGDLSQRYLPTLLGTVRQANPVVPIPVLWLTTAPVGGDSPSIHSAPPRQYNQLPELKFSFSPDNKISSRIISRATELMLEAASQFRGTPVNLHLFIVAASPPAQGAWGVSISIPSQIGQSEWQLLGQRMAQLGIHCHMILPAQQDMSSLNELFVTTLELQGHTQMSPWFPTSPDYTFLLSGNASASPHAGTLASGPVFRNPALDPAVEPVEQPLFPVARPPVLRHQSFPQDAQSTCPPSPAQNVSTPILVSSLQKVHGMSRKKLYGTQPPRQPFVREEPVRAKYKSSPTPLSIPVCSQPFSASEDSRAGCKTKAERDRRVDRPPRVGDTSNSTSPGRRSSWNRVASDVGSPPSSPTTSLSSHHTTSPTMPLYPDIANYSAGPPTTSASFSPAMVTPVPIPDTGFSAPLDPSSRYFSTSPPFRSPPSAATIPIPSQESPWTPMKTATHPTSLAKSPVTTARRHSQELAHMPSLTAMSSKYRLDNAIVDRPMTKKVKDAGDVPFIFSPELEAATAAKLKAALQSTTPASVNGTTTLDPTLGVFTSGHAPDYAVIEDGPVYASLAPPTLTPTSLGYDPARQEMTSLAVLTNDHSHGVNTGNGESVHHTRFALGSTSSSLQGWAG